MAATLISYLVRNILLNNRNIMDLVLNFSCSSQKSIVVFHVK